MSAWAQLVIKKLAGLPILFELEVKGNGLGQSEKEKLDNIVKQFRNASTAKTNARIDCTEILDATEWDVTLR